MHKKTLKMQKYATNCQNEKKCQKIALFLKITKIGSAILEGQIASLMATKLFLNDKNF